jgi:L-aspartate oxidase
MEGVHPQTDLAPRDVVAAAISRRMAQSPGGVDDHVFLDATSIDRFDERFPSITASCRDAGVDPQHQLIPVAPAAHYVCGGIRADLDGVTAMAGLFAVGEAACTGVHGANRLASNSLTESVVSGTRVGRALSWQLPDRVQPMDSPGAVGLLDAAWRSEIRTTMSRHVGVLRSPEDLNLATDALARVADKLDRDVAANRVNLEATNLLTIATAVVAAARTRMESRGCHRRTDVTEPVAAWCRHQIATLRDGRIELS